MNQLVLWKSAVAAQLATLMLFPSAVSQAKNTSPQSQKKTSVAVYKMSSHANSAVDENESNGHNDGIKVHGHWTIVVRNSDGSVASRNEFENALTTGAGDSGDGVISSLLSRNAVAGPWMVILDGYQGVCKNANNTATSCWVVEPNTPSMGGTLAGSNLFSNLTMQRPTSGTNAYAIVLSGTAKATYTGNIAVVRTTLLTCQGNTSPAACLTSQTNFNVIGSFSSQNLTTPITVQAGQSIDVTVVLSFS
jgi:hypothetical protein